MLLYKWRATDVRFLEPGKKVVDKVGIFYSSYGYFLTEKIGYSYHSQQLGFTLIYCRTTLNYQPYKIVSHTASSSLFPVKMLNHSCKLLQVAMNLSH